jgi:hypothetical protein
LYNHTDHYQLIVERRSYASDDIAMIASVDGDPPAPRARLPSNDHRAERHTMSFATAT